MPKVEEKPNIIWRVTLIHIFGIIYLIRFHRSSISSTIYCHLSCLPYLQYPSSFHRDKNEPTRWRYFVHKFGVHFLLHFTQMVAIIFYNKNDLLHRSGPCSLTLLCLLSIPVTIIDPLNHNNQNGAQLKCNTYCSTVYRLR